MNKYKKLAGNTLIFAIGSFSSKILAYLLVRLYTGCLSTSDYGTVDIISQTVNVIYPIISFCMADAIIRFAMDNSYDQKKVFSTAIFATTAGLALFAVLSPLLNLVDTFADYAFLIFAYCYFSTFRQMAWSFVRAKGYVKLFAVDGIVATLNIVIFNLLFLLVFKMGVTGYILAIIISDGLSFIGLTIVGQLYKSIDMKYFSFNLLKDMLKYSAPLIPTYVLWWIISSSDRWFVIKMVGEQDNGIYAASYKIPGLLFMVTTLFFQAWQMSAIENRAAKDVANFYKRIFSFYSSIIFIAGAGLILFVKPFTYLLVDNDPEKNYIFAYHYTPILVVAMVFQCFCQFISGIYNAHNKTVNSLVTSLVAAVVNIVLNFFLIKRYGVYGAAIATLIAYFTCYVLRIFDARRYVRFKVAHLKILINTGIVIYMSYVAINEPPMTYLKLSIAFVVIFLYNMEAVIKTVKKMLKRVG